MFLTSFVEKITDVSSRTCPFIGFQMPVALISGISGTQMSDGLNQWDRTAKWKIKGGSWEPRERMERVARGGCRAQIYFRRPPLSRLPTSFKGPCSWTDDKSTLWRLCLTSSFCASCVTQLCFCCDFCVDTRCFPGEEGPTTFGLGSRRSWPSTLGERIGSAEALSRRLRVIPPRTGSAGGQQFRVCWAWMYRYV